MSGHSKWATTKRQKETTDKKRSLLFSKLARSITVAVKQGGDDPGTNFNLRLAVSRARAANMPKDNIERAIKRGLGENNGANYETIIYEGFGPENTFLIIEVLTDNRNRSVSELKHFLSKNGGSLASQNSVRWQFDQRGLITTDLKKLNKVQENAIIESGALDFVLNEEGCTIITKPTELEKVKNFLENKQISIKNSELIFVPKEKQIIKNAAVWKKFTDGLDELEDVNAYYSNAS